eukprot:7019443-Pyramimonas_sp.AAC.1
MIQYCPPGPGPPGPTSLRHISGTLPVPLSQPFRGASTALQEGPRRVPEAPRIRKNGPRRSQAAQVSLPTALEAP